jgi:hypothetical protein
MFRKRRETAKILGGDFSRCHLVHIVTVSAERQHIRNIPFGGKKKAALDLLFKRRNILAAVQARGNQGMTGDRNDSQAVILD